MQKKNDGWELLEYIAAMVGCMYMSDLHLPFYSYSIHNVVRKIDPSAYSLGEWNQAVQYLTNEKTEFETSEQASKFLQDYMLAGRGGRKSKNKDGGAKA